MQFDFSTLPLYNNYPWSDVSTACTNNQKDYFDHLGIVDFAPGYHTIAGQNGASVDIFLYATNMAWEIQTPVFQHISCASTTPQIQLSLPADFEQSPWSDELTATCGAVTQSDLYSGTYDYWYNDGYQEITGTNGASISFTIGSANDPSPVSGITVTCGTASTPASTTDPVVVALLAVVAFVSISVYIRGIIGMFIKHKGI